MANVINAGLIDFAAKGGLASTSADGGTQSLMICHSVSGQQGRRLLGVYGSVLR